MAIDEDEVEIVSCAELLIHIAERRGEVEPAEEEADGDCLA